MKAKTIEKILRGQFYNFVKSIKDDNVKLLVSKNSIISGGAIVSLILDEKVNDFDIYFTDKATVLAVMHYYKNLLKKDNEWISYAEIKDEGDRVRFFIQSSGYIKPDTKAKFYPLMITDNAISLSNSTQLIIRFFGEPDEIHKNYDFVHVKSYWRSSTGKLYLNPSSLEAILTKELRYTGSLYPLASIFRLRKFLSRGWTISAGDIFKMAFQLRKFDLSKPDVLKDQLIGVDLSYFNELINRVENDMKKGIVTDISETYIMSLVDEIFHETDDEYDPMKYKGDNIHEDED
jgi:hypothetical protein